jgi:hypothetical protein|tara:strand:+ start:345 stop:896 length:552 start_codon:yes stop_codon:yes gene_type:complete
MSAVLDFRELRDKVLAGEGDEDAEAVQSPFNIEATESKTLVAICLSAGFAALYGYDRSVNKVGGWFEGGIGTACLTLGIMLPLGYAVGALNRGLEAQTEKDRYEKLLDESQTVIEEQQEEIESMESENEEKEAEQQAEAENDYQYDYLDSKDSFFHGPSLGMGVTAFGQEGVLYRPKDTGMLW